MCVLAVGVYLFPELLAGKRPARAVCYLPSPWAVTRAQLPLAPLSAGKYNKPQGKTLRGIGHTTGGANSDDFSAGDYTQHLYMILGRAERLDWILLRNLPTTANDALDLSISTLCAHCYQPLTLTAKTQRATRMNQFCRPYLSPT